MLKLYSARNMLVRLTQQSRASIANFTQADLPKFDFVPDKYDGPSPDQLMAWRKAYVNPAIYTFYKEPLTITQGKMQYLYDEKGRRYIDFLGGIVTISAGHCHPKVVAALHKQMNLLWHCTTVYNHPPLAEYAAKLASKFPEPLKVAYFVNSGSEANDLALMLARLHTGCQDIISLRYAYHGISPYVQPLSCLSTWRHNVPLGGGHHHVITPDPYRGIWGGKNCRNSISQVKGRDCDCKEGQCKACDMYVNDVDDLMTAACTKTKVGGFIAESIMGASGTVQFPRDYLKRVYKLIRAKGGVCIADEVQTGWGRCGDAYWGFQTHGVMPDIVTLAKGIGNGFPLAAVVCTPEIAASLTRAFHFNTFGGNPMACAVGKAVIEVIDEEKMQENSKEVGNYSIRKLMKMQKNHPVIGDIRGLGLMHAIELVEDPVKRTPLPIAKVNELMDLMKERFVVVGKTGLNGNIFRFKPPMCVTKKDIDYVMAAFEDSLKAMGL